MQELIIKLFVNRLLNIISSYACTSKWEEMQSSASQNVFPLNEKFCNELLFSLLCGADSLLYVKTSYRSRPAFYIKDASGEHKLRVKDISIDEQFSYRNGKIVYAAYETDPRWGWKDYGVIKLLDLAYRSGSKQSRIKQNILHRIFLLTDQKLQQYR